MRGSHQGFPHHRERGSSTEVADKSVLSFWKGLGDSHIDELLYKGLRQWTVDWELKCPGRRPVVSNLVLQGRKYGTAMRQVAEMVLERCESGDDFPLHPECRETVGDSFVSVGHHLKDGLAQALQRRPFRLIEVGQVFVNLGTGQGRFLADCRRRASALPALPFRRTPNSWRTATGHWPQVGPSPTLTKPAVGNIQPTRTCDLLYTFTTSELSGEIRSQGGPTDCPDGIGNGLIAGAAINGECSTLVFVTYPINKVPKYSGT